MLTFAEFREAHPEATVVSTDTGHARNYKRNTCEVYFRTDRLMFPVARRDKRLDAKATVVGVKQGDTVRAYPVKDVRSAAGGKISEKLGDERLVLEATEGGVSMAEAPEEARVVHTFWFSWAAFHPDTTVYGQEGRDAGAEPAARSTPALSASPR